LTSVYVEPCAAIPEQLVTAKLVEEGMPWLVVVPGPLPLAVDTARLLLDVGGLLDV